MRNKDTLIRVNGNEFFELMFWLERCSDKGHLDNCFDLVVPWESFSGYDVIEDRVGKEGGANADPV